MRRASWPVASVANLQLRTYARISGTHSGGADVAAERESCRAAGTLQRCLVDEAGSRANRATQLRELPCGQITITCRPCSRA